MSPLKLRSPRVLLAECVTLCAAVVAFIAVTAAQGPQAISVPLPTLPTIIESVGFLLIGEMLRRALDRLKAVGEKCDETAKDFSEFRARIETGLLGLNGESGALSAIEHLSGRMSNVEQRLPPLGPRDVGTFDRRHQ